MVDVEDVLARLARQIRECTSRGQTWYEEEVFVGDQSVEGAIHVSMIKRIIDAIPVLVNTADVQYIMIPVENAPPQRRLRITWCLPTPHAE